MPKHSKSNSDMTGTTSLDLPPALQQLFAMNAPPPSDGVLPSYFGGGIIDRTREALLARKNGEGVASTTVRTGNSIHNPDNWKIFGLHIPPPAFDMGMAESSQAVGEQYDPFFNTYEPGPSAGLAPAEFSGGLHRAGSWMPGTPTAYTRMQGPGQFQSLSDIPGVGTLSRVAQGIGNVGRSVLGLVPGADMVGNWISGSGSGNDRGHGGDGYYADYDYPSSESLVWGEDGNPQIPQEKIDNVLMGSNVARGQSPYGTPVRASGSYRSPAGNVVGHVDPSSISDASMNPGMTPMMEHAAQQFREQASITERAMGGPIQPGQTYSVAEIEPEVVDTPQGRQVFTEPTVIQPTQPGYVHAGPKGQQLGAQAAQPMDPQMLQMHINQFAQQHPEQMQQVQVAIKEAMSSGELAPQELNTIVQLATVAAQNPAMYPHVRQYAIQQGLAGENDVSPEYDQGLVFSLLIAGRAVQQMSGTGQPQIPSMKKGGALPSVGDNRSMVIEAHDGEYVVPKHVVDMKGREFFDNLVKRYTEGNEQ